MQGLSSPQSSQTGSGNGSGSNSPVARISPHNSPHTHHNSTGTKMKKGMYKTLDTKIGLPVIPKNKVCVYMCVYVSMCVPCVLLFCIYMHQVLTLQFPSILQVRQSKDVYLSTTSPIKLGMRNFWMKTLDDFTPKVHDAGATRVICVGTPHRHTHKHTHSLSPHSCCTCAFIYISLLPTTTTTGAAPRPREHG